MSRHLKRLATPRTWTIPKKTAVWATKPRPGAHASDRSMPFGLIIRDALQLADTAREARSIITSGKALVDGRPVKDAKAPVGTQDVVSIPETDTHYRVVLDKKGRLALVEIDSSAATWKLCRIENKTTVKGGRTQLNLHDGRNLLVKEDVYSTNDVLKLRVPDQEIMGHFPFTAGAPALVTGGSHVGQFATILEPITVKASSPNLVRLEGAEEFETIEPYVFVVGATEPEITLPAEVIA